MIVCRARFGFGNLISPPRSSQRSTTEQEEVTEVEEAYCVLFRATVHLEVLAVHPHACKARAIISRLQCLSLKT